MSVENEYTVIDHRLMLNGVGDCDAISLEDKLLYGNPTRQVDVSDFISETAIKRFLCVHESHTSE